MAIDFESGGKVWLQKPPLLTPLTGPNGLLTQPWAQWMQSTAWYKLNEVSGYTSGASDIIPLMSGIANPGTLDKYSRGDHRHPTDTSRASEVDMLAAEADIVDLYDLRKTIYAGAVCLPTITDNGSGNFDVSDCIVNLYADVNDPTTVNRYTVTGGSFSITPNVVGYVYVDYNGGNPIMGVTMNRDDITDTHLLTKAIVATVGLVGGTLKVRTWDRIGIGLPEKRLDRGFDTEDRYSRSLSVGGFIITDTGSHHFKVSAGRMWTVIEPLDLDDVISETDVVTLWYRDGSNVWQSTTVTGYNYTQYNAPGGGLVTLTNNRYAVNYLFREVNDQLNHVCIVLGIGDYKLNEAQTAGVPTSLPPALTVFGKYVGKIIVKKNAASATQITSAFEEGGSETAVVVHNETLERDAADAHPTSSITNGAGSWAEVGTDTHMYNGFVNKPSSTVTVSTRTFTVAPTLVTFAYYNEGLKVVKTGGATCQTTCPATVGLHYIYFDTTGQLVNSMTPWVWDNGYVFVALGYWNGTAMARFEERHGAGRDVRLHEYLHNTRGTAYNSGLSQTYPSTSLDAYVQIESGIIYDEDNKLPINQTTRIRHWYQTTGGVWTWADGVPNGITYDRPTLWNAVTSRVQYPKSDSAYALTDVDASKYVCVWVYANNDMDRPIAAITQARTSNHTTLAQARAETQPTTNPIAPEFKLLYRWIFKGNGDFIEAADYRLADPIPGGGTTTAIHNTLLGLDGGETGYYGHLTSAQATNVALINPTAGKTLSWTQSLTLAGTDSTTHTFPSTNSTLARTDTGQTFTGANLFNNTAGPTVFYGYSLITTSANAANGYIKIGSNASYYGILDFDQNGNTTYTIKNAYANAAAKIDFVTNGASRLYLNGTSAVFGSGVGVQMAARSSIIADNDSAVFKIGRSGGSTGNISLGCLGNRDTTNTYDTLRMYNGALSRNLDFTFDDGLTNVKITSSTGVVNFGDTTASTSYTTGCVTFSGGVGISGKVFVNDYINSTRGYFGEVSGSNRKIVYITYGSSLYYIQAVEDGIAYRDLTLNPNGGNVIITNDIKVSGKSGFNGTDPIAKPTVSGSRGGNAALASLLTALANYGLITDSTTA